MEKRYKDLIKLDPKTVPKQKHNTINRFNTGKTFVTAARLAAGYLGALSINALW